jgi:hypothetical protein
MKTQGQSSLLELSLFRRNSFSRLYHIHPDYFKSYNDLLSLTQYILSPTFAFGIDIPSETFMYMFELVTHINMQSQYPSTAKIDIFELPEISGIRNLFHSLSENIPH